VSLLGERSQEQVSAQGMRLIGRGRRDASLVGRRRRKPDRKRSQGAPALRRVRGCAPRRRTNPSALSEWSSDTQRHEHRKGHDHDEERKRGKPKKTKDAESTNRRSSRRTLSVNDRRSHEGWVSRIRTDAFPDHFARPPQSRRGHSASSTPIRPKAQVARAPRRDRLLKSRSLAMLGPQSTSGSARL